MIHLQSCSLMHVGNPFQEAENTHLANELLGLYYCTWKARTGMHIDPIFLPVSYTSIMHHIHYASVNCNHTDLGLCKIQYAIY